MAPIRGRKGKNVDRSVTVWPATPVQEAPPSSGLQTEVGDTSRQIVGKGKEVGETSRRRVGKGNKAARPVTVVPAPPAKDTPPSNGLQAEVRETSRRRSGRASVKPAKLRPQDGGRVEHPGKVETSRRRSGRPPGKPAKLKREKFKSKSRLWVDNSSDWDPDYLPQPQPLPRSRKLDELQPGGLRPPGNKIPQRLLSCHDKDSDSDSSGLNSTAAIYYSGIHSYSDGDFSGVDSTAMYYSGITYSGTPVPLSGDARQSK